MRSDVLVLQKVGGWIDPDNPILFHSAKIRAGVLYRATLRIEEDQAVKVRSPLNGSPSFVGNFQGVPLQTGIKGPQVAGAAAPGILKPPTEAVFQILDYA